jgi:hypothetical protein
MAALLVSAAPPVGLGLLVTIAMATNGFSGWRYPLPGVTSSAPPLPAPLATTTPDLLAGADPSACDLDIKDAERDLFVPA